MAKPSETYEFATGDGATSDPASRRASGFVAGQRLPAKWLNYLLNGYGKWASYVNNLHAEPEFLNKGYAWTGAHTFDEAIAVAGTVTANDYQQTTRIPRTWMVPLTAFRVVGNDPKWTFLDVDEEAFGVSAGIYWLHSGSSQNSRISATLKLPHGTRIQRVRTLVYTPGLKMAVSRLFSNKETGGVIRTPIVEHTFTANDLFDSGAIAGDLDIEGPTDVLGISFTTTTTSVDPSRVCWVELTYLDPGPRNY